MRPPVTGERAGKSSLRWVGTCYRCKKDTEVETRNSHAAQALCDACAARPHRRPRATGLEPVLTPAIGEPPSPASELAFLTTREIHDRTPPEPDWIWRGYLARRAITLVAGRPKAGKSTLLAALVIALTSGAEAFLGCPVACCEVVVLSEEGHSTLAGKFASSDKIHLADRETTWPLPAWDKAIEQATVFALRCGAPVLVVDTFGFWAQLAKDAGNDSGAIAEAMKPLVAATRAGLAVVLVHHQNKSGGRDGQAILGSTHLSAAVDAIVEIERTDETAPTQRQVLSRSRWDATPDALIYERRAATGEITIVGEHGDRKTVREEALRRQLLGILPACEPGVRTQAIEAQLGDKRDWKPVIDTLIEAGVVERTGAGRKGSPFRYHRRLVSVEPGRHGNHTATTEAAPRPRPVSGVGTAYPTTRNDAEVATSEERACDGASQ